MRADAAQPKDRPHVLAQRHQQYCAQAAAGQVAEDDGPHAVMQQRQYQRGRAGRDAARQLDPGSPLEQQPARHQRLRHGADRGDGELQREHLGDQRQARLAEGPSHQRRDGRDQGADAQLQ